MDLLKFNILWMAVNVFLAFIPVAAGFLMLKNKSKIIKILAGIVWIIFLPNSIYLLTDITHFFEDAPKLKGDLLYFDLFLYLMLVVFGILTFILSVYPFEKVFTKKTKKGMKSNLKILFGLNLLVGFGMVLGRFQRTNSWEIFTNTKRVVMDTLHTFSSLELMIMVVIFAVLCQIIYTTFDEVVLRNIR